MFNTKRVEKYRVLTGDYGSDRSDGNNGLFALKNDKRKLACLISDGMGWEHVSVSSNRIPVWMDMVFVRNMFWEEEDVVIQIHPPLSEYVNCHPSCLHLWRNIDHPIALPPSFLVGPK